MRFSHQSGLPGIDAASYSAPVERVYTRSFAATNGIGYIPPVPTAQSVDVARLTVNALACFFTEMRCDVAPVEGVRAKVVPREGWILIPATLRSTWQSADGQPGVLHFHFDDALVAELSDEFTGDPGAFRFEPSVGWSNARLARIAREARRELVFGDGASRFALESLHLRALADLARASGSLVGRIPPAGAHAMTDARMRRLTDYVESHLAGDIALDDLARVVGVSRPHLARAFRAATGTSPYRWVTERRVERAKTLLATTGEPIAAIALACGFGSQSHFSQVFREIAGTTPRQWRYAAR